MWTNSCLEFIYLPAKFWITMGLFPWKGREGRVNTKNNLLKHFELVTKIKNVPPTKLRISQKVSLVLL